MRGNILILLPVLIPIIAGIIINKQNIKSIHRIVYGITGLNLLVLLGILSLEDRSLELLRINEFIYIKFNIDQVSSFFTILVSTIWILVAFYALKYMDHEGNEGRFFRFFMISLGVIIALGFSGNMISFYVFYELMTLITYPLVVHSGTREAMKAGIKYLIYSFFGAALVLIGIIASSYYGISGDFIPGGILDISKVNNIRDFMLLIYVLSFVGFGSKAGMFPLHTWLALAHPVAPAPASGLLSGLITKAGVLGILRITYFIFGPDFIRGSWAQTLVLILTIFTIFMGSMLALRSKLLKERLAYSSISQVSYVLFGLALLNMEGFLGALLHLVFHALIKNILFLSVGAIIYKTGKHYVYEMKGIGKSMPVNMWCFALGSLALVGVPPLGGFISKYYLGLGGLGLSAYNLGFLGVVTLIVSAILTAGYLIPIFRDAFFPGANFDYSQVEKLEPSMNIIIPIIIMVAAVGLLGMFPQGLIGFFTDIANTVI